MTKAKDTRDLTKEVCIAVAKAIKNGTGKGPIDTEVTLGENFLLVKLMGHILPNEMQLAKSYEGYYHVKVNRQKWADTNRANLMQQLSGIIGKEIHEYLYDINPKTNLGVMVFFFS